MSSLVFQFIVCLLEAYRTLIMVRLFSSSSCSYILTFLGVGATLSSTQWFLLALHSRIHLAGSGDLSMLCLYREPSACTLCPMAVGCAHVPICACVCFPAHSIHLFRPLSSIPPLMLSPRCPGGGGEAAQFLISMCLSEKKKKYRTIWDGVALCLVSYGFSCFQSKCLTIVLFL